MPCCVPLYLTVIQLNLLCTLLVIVVLDLLCVNMQSTLYVFNFLFTTKKYHFSAKSTVYLAGILYVLSVFCFSICFISVFKD